MNNQQPHLSRRDWFRLRQPNRLVAQQQKLGSQGPVGVQPIDDPVNHGGVDLTALPPMHEATLDANEVSTLFADIAQHATAVSLIAARAEANAPDGTSKLAVARDQLLSGDVRKLQIRYEWADARWIDTLQRAPKGFRLVRIQHVK